MALLTRQASTLRLCKSRMANEVCKPPGHRQGADVGRPNLIGPLDGEGGKKGRIDLVALLREAGAVFSVDRLNAPQVHERGPMTAGDRQGPALGPLGGPACSQ